MRFEFATAQRIVFGNGVLKEAGGIAKELGTRAIVVTGLNPERSQPLLEVLTAQEIPACLVPVLREPSVATVQAGVASAQEFGADFVAAAAAGGDAGESETLYVELRKGKETLDPAEWFVMNPIVGEATQGGSGQNATGQDGTE